MQLEVGLVLEGKVTGITKFSAFVELPEGKTGMVHISEIAPVFVNDIHDFVKLNDVVKVKILSIAEDGKIGLSMKRAIDPPPRPARKPGAPFDRPQRRNISKPIMPAPERPNFEWQQKEKGGTFEDMLTRFKQTSDDKISDIKKGVDSKRGGYSRGNRGAKKG